jgi:predicted ArsR family transcriptional regulator
MLERVERGAIAALAALDDDVRAALFEHVRDSPAPVTRESAANAVGISRKLAAFHLDRLVAAGLLEAEIEPAHRVGRAPKVYRVTRRSVTVCVPEREHEMLAEILLDAVLDEREGERAVDSAARVACERGVAMGRAGKRPGRMGAERALTAIADTLGEHGYQPRRDRDLVRLRNCPFHPMAAAEPALVCGLNHAFIRGVIEGLDAPAAVQAVLAPGADACCVQIQSNGSSPGTPS